MVSDWRMRDIRPGDKLEVKYFLCYDGGGWKQICKQVQWDTLENGEVGEVIRITKNAKPVDPNALFEVEFSGRENILFTEEEMRKLTRPIREELKVKVRRRRK